MSGEDRVDVKYLGGERIVAPGHPITLAYLIVKCYPIQADFSKALQDDVVPGSLESLSFAVNGLLAIKNKHSTFQEFREKASKFWSRTCERLGEDGGGGGSGTEAGQAQANDVATHLFGILKWRQWI